MDNKKKCTHLYPLYIKNGHSEGASLLYCRGSSRLINQKIIIEFDKNVWLSVVEYLTVHHDGLIEFTFRNGSKVEIER